MVVDGYVRVSQVGGRRGERFTSPGVQREKIESWARLHGAVLAEVFEELDESGARRDRPLLLEAVRRVETGESAGIVVAKLDRFGRSLSDGLAVIERITTAGGTFVAVDDGFDFGTDTGRLVLRIMLSMAEWELDRIRTGWAAARSRAVARGVHPAPSPTGYVRKPDGRLVVDPSLGPVIADLFRRRAEGATPTALADWLTAQRLPTTRGNPQWVPNTVAGILSNRVYLGEVHHGSAINTAAHEPLTDSATWTRAQSPNEQPRERPEVHPALLRGMVRCASCRRVISAGSPGGGRRLYRCISRRSWGICPAPASVQQNTIDPFVEAIFWQELERTRRSARSAKLLDGLENRAQKQEQELAAYRDNPRLPLVLGAERFELGLAVRVRRVETTLLELAAAKRERADPVLLPAAKLRKEWPSLSTQDKRAAVLEIVDCVFVRPGRGDRAEKLVVCLRGRAPADLPRFGRQQFRQYPPLDHPKPFRGAKLRKENRRPWDEPRLRGELGEFTRGRMCWPSFAEFQEEGQALLSWQVEMHGGHRRWAFLFKLPLEPQRAYIEAWSPDRIRRELTEFLPGHEHWPTWPEFRDAGYGRLRTALGSFGGPEKWAGEFGFKLRQSARTPDWSPHRIEAALRELTAGRTTWPSKADFEEAGMSSLYLAIRRRRQQDDWPRRFGFPPPGASRAAVAKWTGDEIETHLRRLVAACGRWPTVREFRAAQLNGLYLAISYSDRSHEEWARRLGVQPTRRHRWTDDEAEASLRTLIAEHGTWPRWRDFKAAGLAGLHQSLIRRGELERWAKHLCPTGESPGEGTMQVRQAKGTNEADRLASAQRSP